MIYPFVPDSYPEPQIYNHGSGTSIILVGRFELPKFKMDNEELAEVFGRELATMVVDECLSPG